MGPSRSWGGKAIGGLAAAVVLVIVVLGVSTWEDGAQAWEQDPCPMGQTWNESVRACEELEDKTGVWVVLGVTGGLSLAVLAFFVGFGMGRRWERIKGGGEAPGGPAGGVGARARRPTIARAWEGRSAAPAGAWEASSGVRPGRGAWRGIVLLVAFAPTPAPLVATGTHEHGGPGPWWW